MLEKVTGKIWNGNKEGKKIQVQNEWETKLKPTEKMGECWNDEEGRRLGMTGME